METWNGEGFGVSVHVSESLLYIKLTGVVGLSPINQAVAFAAGVATVKPHAAQLFDYRRAVLVVSEADMLRVPVSQKSKWRPAAYLVPDHQEEMFKRHAWRLASMGLERAVFTSGSSALAWARAAATRARVRAALDASRAMTQARGSDPLAFAPSGPGAL
jgi:hypothetical protein